VFPLNNKENVQHELIDIINELVDNVQELRRRKQLGRKIVLVMTLLLILLKMNL
jgi:hypothetical protein